MPFSADYFADVAAVYTDGAFGSGRLIAPGLVLTAGHVVDMPQSKRGTGKGWKVRLLRERTKEGVWTASPHDADLIWRGQKDLDLALMRIDEDAKPLLTPLLASYDQLGTIDAVHATGFPESWLTPAGELRDYTVQGGLRRAAQWGPYVWTVASADKPDDPRGWKGMSGAAICSEGSGNKLYLFGVVQQVPANFSGGMLEVARASDGVADTVFTSHLRAALGHEPSVVSWGKESAYGFSRPGLSEFVEKLKDSEAAPSGRDDLLVKLAGRAAVSEQALLTIARRLGVDNIPANELGPALMDRIDRLHLAERHVDALPDNPIKPLAKAATAGGDYERAEKLLTVALRQIDSIKLIDDGKPDLAIKALEEAEQQLSGISNEGSVDDQIALGYIYKSMEQVFSAKGDKARADQYLQKALAVFQSLKHETIPDGTTVIPFATVMNGLGNLSAARDQHKEAIHYYQVATSLLPAYAYAWHDMFLSYYALAEKGEANLVEMAAALANTKEAGKGLTPFSPAYFKRLDDMMARFTPANRPRSSSKKQGSKRR